MNYVFISNFYDYPLSGTCLYNNKLHRFEVEDDGEYYNVYPLSLWEKVKAKVHQKAFELCVGYHWSWNGNKRSSFFYYRKPEWFYRWLFNVYYKVTMK